MVNENNAWRKWWGYTLSSNASMPKHYVPEMLNWKWAKYRSSTDFASRLTQHSSVVNRQIFGQWTKISSPHSKIRHKYLKMQSFAFQTQTACMQEAYNQLQCWLAKYFRGSETQVFRNNSDSKSIQAQMWTQNNAVLKYLPDESAHFSTLRMK